MVFREQRKREAAEQYKGAKVRIKYSVECHQSFHDGGTLAFQGRDEADRDEYRVGIKTGVGVCHCFHPDDYELLVHNNRLVVVNSD